MVQGILTQGTMQANKKQGILDLPNYKALQDTLDAYYENDTLGLTQMVVEKYEATSGKLLTVPLRFFRTFINEQASLYSNTFTRVAGGEFNQDALNQSLMDMERYDTRTGYYWYQEDINQVVLYRTEGDQVKKYRYVGDSTVQEIALEFRTLVLEEVLSAFNYHEDLTTQFYIFDQDLDYLPILEITQPRVRTATGNDLVTLQENYIASMSWGLFNADPKLLSQMVLNTSIGNEEAKKNFANLGLTTKAIKLQVMDTVQFMDTGDIKVLDDLITIYGKLLEQQALQKGVDKNSIINNNKMVSGESKKVELNYINKYRRNFFIQFMNFEKRLFEHIISLANGISYEGVQFMDIDLAPDPMEQVLLAAEMQDRKFLTFAEAFAMVRNITVEEAEQEVKERKIELDKSGNLVVPEIDVTKEGANYEPRNKQQPEPQPRNPDTRPRTGK